MPIHRAKTVLKATISKSHIRSIDLFSKISNFHSVGNKITEIKRTKKRYFRDSFNVWIICENIPLIIEINKILNYNM